MTTKGGSKAGPDLLAFGGGADWLLAGGTHRGAVPVGAKGWAATALRGGGMGRHETNC